MKGYESASYQQDIMEELARQAEVFFYGPGFNNYDIKDSIDDVLVKAPFDPDTIILGHAWLGDKDDSEVDPHPRLQLSKTTIPKSVILNKEYTNLDAKLGYIKRNHFDVGFTHHHDTDRYSEVTGTEFTFWPFAYDSERFKYSNGKKTIDVGFSGVLQNLNKDANQTDIRIKIMKHFYVTMFDVPISKRKAFKDIEIFWNSIARNKIGKYLSYMLNKQQYLSATDYARMMRKTKIYINTLSPMGLISPRFFECMASKSLVFCEESSLYSNIFPDDLYVVFSSDLSDFQDKLLWILGNESTRSTIVEKAYKHVLSNHSWKDRVLMLLNKISFDSSYKIPNPIDTKAKV
jgi:hypothetical protein